jgi:hypothetical protein
MAKAAEELSSCANADPSPAEVALLRRRVLALLIGEVQVSIQ